MSLLLRRLFVERLSVLVLQLEAPVVERIERLLSAQLSAGREASVSAASSFLPNVWDVPQFFASLAAHPPVILCVLLVRLLVASIASGLHVAFRLPDVKNPQEDDLGFVANLVLSSRPALKGAAPVCEHRGLSWQRDTHSLTLLGCVVATRVLDQAPQVTG